MWRGAWWPATSASAGYGVIRVQTSGCRRRRRGPKISRPNASARWSCIEPVLIAAADDGDGAGLGELVRADRRLSADRLRMRSGVRARRSTPVKQRCAIGAVFKPGHYLLCHTNQHKLSKS